MFRCNLVNKEKDGTVTRREGGIKTKHTRITSRESKGKINQILANYLNAHSKSRAPSSSPS